MSRLVQISDRERLDVLARHIDRTSILSGFLFATRERQSGLLWIEDVRDYSLRPVLDRFVMRYREEEAQLRRIG